LGGVAVSESSILITGTLPGPGSRTRCPNPARRRAANYRHGRRRRDRPAGAGAAPADLPALDDFAPGTVVAGDHEHLTLANHRRFGNIVGDRDLPLRHAVLPGDDRQGVAVLTTILHRIAIGGGGPWRFSAVFLRSGPGRDRSLARGAVRPRRWSGARLARNDEPLAHRQDGAGLQVVGGGEIADLDAMFFGQVP